MSDALTSAVDDITLRAWAYLSRVAEPPCPLLARFVADVGPVAAAQAIRAGAEPAKLTERVQARRGVDRAGADIDQLHQRGWRLLTPHHPEWPYLAFSSFPAVARTKPQGWPPMVLWAQGPAALDEVALRAAAIVGTRAATAYGEYVAADLAGGLVERDVAVVSGGAYGIDGAAHRATLSAEGTTVAILAGGLDIPYPAGHSALLHRIGASGLLVTEYPPGERPARYRFLTRNRLVAAFSGASVVVEAGLRSGAANTAAWARELGRVVCAVPGPVTSSASAGCHELLRGGAQLVTRADEVVELVGRAGELADEPVHPASALDGLGEGERRVYEALPARGVHTTEQVSVGAAMPADQVLGPLALLEVAGLIERHLDGWRIVPGQT